MEFHVYSIQVNKTSRYIYMYMYVQCILSTEYANIILQTSIYMYTIDVLSCTVHGIT